jgi:hypothetical protein
MNKALEQKLVGTRHNFTGRPDYPVPSVVLFGTLSAFLWRTYGEIC